MCTAWRVLFIRVALFWANEKRHKALDGNQSLGRLGRGGYIFKGVKYSSGLSCAFLQEGEHLYSQTVGANHFTWRVHHGSFFFWDKICLHGCSGLRVLCSRLEKHCGSDCTKALRDPGNHPIGDHSLNKVASPHRSFKCILNFSELLIEHKSLFWRCVNGYHYFRFHIFSCTQLIWNLNKEYLIAEIWSFDLEWGSVMSKYSTLKKNKNLRKRGIKDEAWQSCDA